MNVRTLQIRQYKERIGKKIPQSAL